MSPVCIIPEKRHACIMGELPGYKNNLKAFIQDVRGLGVTPILDMNGSCKSNTP